MNGFLTKAGMAIALGATALVGTAASADAQRYGGGYRGGYGGYGHGYRGGRGGDVATGALLGGILGLGVGAAIANNGRDRYYDRGYYNDGYYYDRRPRVIYRQRYYAPPRVVYRDRYRGSRYGYGDGYYGGGYGNGYYGY
jgi:hypothetical protein